MSTFTAVGPALDLDGPLPVAPPYSLLKVPGVLQPPGSEGGRWATGAVIDSFPVDTPFDWEPCSTGTFRVKEEGSESPLPRFDPFGIYIPLMCSSPSVGGRWEAWKSKAEAVLEATQSWGVERALAAGVDGSTNPFLGDSNVTVLGGAAGTPDVGLSWLENAIGATGRQGLIHASPAVAAAWGFNKLETGDALYTVNGTPVAVGGGYANVTVDGDDPGDGEDYAFATGPVEVRLSEAILLSDDIAESLDRSNNDVVIRAERYALATWDTALQAAVLIDWSPT